MDAICVTALASETSNVNRLRGSFLCKDILAHIHLVVEALLRQQGVMGAALGDTAAFDHK